MKKILISVFFIFGFAANAFYQRSLGSNTLTQNITPIVLQESSSLVIKEKTPVVVENTSINNIVANNQPVGDDYGDEGEYDDDRIAVRPVKIAPAPTLAPVIKPTPTSAPTSTPSSKPTPVPTPVVNQGKYKNGTYNGSQADASYGIIQVQAVITNGKISDVKFLSYPNDRQHSLQVSNYAMPILKREAITAQSENVNTVSGASYTSAAFIESLGSALSQAI